MKFFEYAILVVWMAGCAIKSLRSYTRAVQRRAELDAERNLGGPSEADAMWFRGKKGENWSQVVGFGLFGFVGILELLFPDAEGFSSVPALMGIGCFLLGIAVIAWGDEYRAYCERRMARLRQKAGTSETQGDRIERALTDAAAQRTGDRPLEQADRDQTGPHREATERRMDAQDRRMDRMDGSTDGTEEGETNGEDGK